MYIYKGYLGKTEEDPVHKIFYGSVINTCDIITFTADNVKELHQAFQDSVDDYLSWAIEDKFLPDIFVIP